MHDSKKQSYLQGAAILAAASIFVKIIGAVYKIPITNILGDAGMGYFQTTYNIYSLILTISTAGIPVALSRMVSSARASGKPELVKRYFSVALPAFSVVGISCMLLMFFFADNLAAFMNNSLVAPGIRVLAPAVLFACIISVYRGYAQGFENMVPTAVSQVAEVVCKAAFGIPIMIWLIKAGYALHYASAGAIMGVMVGLGIAVPLLIFYKRKIDKRLFAADSGARVISGRSSASLESRSGVLKRLLSVSVPITLGASFMSIMTLIDTSVVLGRLQNGLGLSEYDASAMFGIYTKGLIIYNLPPALIVPISVSIVPAIAAAIARGRDKEAGSVMQSSIKIVNLLAMPAGVGLMALARPILAVLFGDSSGTARSVLTILGAASFFVCLQLITTAILQATGHERVTMLTFPIGGLLQIALDYYLVGNPEVGIIGSPFGTLTCYSVISLLNIAFIMVKVKNRPKFGGVFIKPLLCTAVMGVAAYSVYELLFKVLSGVLGAGRLSSIIYLAGAIVVAMILYLVLIVVTRTVTRDDMKLIPKGEKLADLLKIK